VREERNVDYEANFRPDGSSTPTMNRVVARSPGRVNLIGEHTDYNDGFVMPMGLPFETVFTATARADNKVCLHSEGYGEINFTLADDPRSIKFWGRFVAGMAKALDYDGTPVPGFDAEIKTDIPVGASLSSSAALEVAAGFAMCQMAGVEPDPVRIAKLGQWVENEIIGIQSGIMDQLISAVATEGAATLIDCRSLETQAFALPTNSTVVIMDTMTRRRLADSEYDLRRASCERAAAEIGVNKLRDATIEQVDNLGAGVDARRARHVVTENARVLSAVEAMKSGDAVTLGRLMNDSHESLRTDFEVSAPALDEIVAVGRKHSACFGARMTGGGFAGCGVALVDSSEALAFRAHVQDRYAAPDGASPNVWIVEPSAGASVTTQG
jgi:galactokinase